MKETVRFLGLDVHAATIAVAIAEPDGSVRSLGVITSRTESIRQLVKKSGPVEQLKACYEAGPTGYVLYWQLAELGVACEVIAPTLAPVKAGEVRHSLEQLATVSTFAPGKSVAEFGAFLIAKKGAWGKRAALSTVPLHGLPPTACQHSR